MSNRKQRSANATVTLQELATRRRFKYTCHSKEYYITLPKKGILADTIERQVAKIIELDIIRNNHDDTQRSYKEMLVTGTLTEVITPLIIETKFNRPILHQELLSYYTKTGRDASKDFYNACYVMLKNWGNISVDEIPQKLMNMKYAVKTFNNRKGILNSFCEWLVRADKIKFNPIYDVPSKKKSASKLESRKALTNEEVIMVLDVIKSNKYMKAKSMRYPQSHYYPFMVFIAYTGCRPAEAIGLEVKKIDLTRKIITIDSSLARSRYGTSAKFRTRKGTKMNDSRELSYEGSELLEQILITQCRGRKLNDLVFPSPTGVSIDDSKINNNVLKPVFDGLGIQRRILYAFRHSFASRCFASGMDIKTVQSLTGHRDASVLLNTYAEASVTKVSVPNLI